MFNQTYQQILLGASKKQNGLRKSSAGVERTACHNNYDKGLNRAQATLSRELDQSEGRS